jgi:hypothetical protein
MRCGFLNSLIAMVILGFAGCTTLPPGDPPKGPIVQPGEFKKNFSTEGAVNYMVTSLSAFCLRELPGGTVVALDFKAPDAKLNILPKRVFLTVASLARLRLVSPESSKVSLISRITGKDKLNWLMELKENENNSVIWQEKIVVE